MLNNPKLIVADEPTAHLDSVTAANIVALLKQVAEKGTAVVISTHNSDILDKFPGKVYECAENELRIKN
ncbi:MAG: phosphonate ABC transporter ATP-binding protein, partial [Prevotella sp.]|nr:phosphonate ABC transporter ATP-binding protein [Prevotella sp.]